MKIRLLARTSCVRLFIATTALLMGGCSLIATSTSSTPSQANTTIRVGGSSETYSVLTQLTEAYEAETEQQVTFEFLPPSQTNSGIQGINNKEFNIGGVSRQLTTTEKTAQINYTPLVTAPLVVVVHDSVTGVTDLTAEQVKGIYSGDISNWQELGGPNAEIILLDLVEDENEKQILRETYLDNDLQITSKAIVFAEDDELLETAANTEYSIAAVPQEEDIDEAPVKELSLDGVEPSAENIASGAYLMSMSLGMVSHADADTDVLEFIEFVTGPEGQAILTEADDDDDDD